LAEGLDPERALAVREVLRLVPVRVCDVGEVDVERRAGLDHLIGPVQDRGERGRLGEAAVGDRVQVGEVEDRPDPGAPRGDREHILGCAQLPDPAHDLDAERDRAVLLLQPLPKLAELLDD